MTANGSKNPMAIRITSKGINATLIALSIIFAIVPEFEKSLSKTLWIAVILLWYIHTVFFYRGRKNEAFKAIGFSLLLLIWFIWNILLLVFGISDAEIGNYFIMLAFSDMLIKTAFIAQYYSDTAKKRLVVLIHLVMLICVIQNIYLGYAYPKIHFFSSIYPEKYAGMNVAETEFYNTLAFMVGIDIYLLLDKKRLFGKNLIVTIMVVSLFFMFNFEPRTNAIIIVVLMAFAAFFSREMKTSNRILSIILVIVIAAITIIFLGPTIILILPERVRPRIEAVLNISRASISGNMYLERFDLTLNSINTFLGSIRNFVFGIGYHLGSEYYQVVGQHSQLIDYFAWYGCLGGMYLFALFGGIKKYIINRDNNMCIAYSKRVLNVFIFASLVTLSFRPEIIISSLLLNTLISFHNGEEEYQ